MEIEEALAIKRDFQSLFLEFLENNDDDCDIFMELTKYIIDSNISKNHQDLQDIFYMISNIVNYHKREHHFFDKIIQVLKFILPDIQSHFNNIDLYNIFKTNKLFLLFLIQQKVIIPTTDLINIIKQLSTEQFTTIHKSAFVDGKPVYSISSEKLPNRYFLYTSFKSYVNNSIKKQIEKEIRQKFDTDIKTFEKKCQKGENDSFICGLIREDLIDEFVIHVNKTNYPLNSTIDDSIFECNFFLINKNPTLIEYATFCGSIQIFKYLQINQVQINESIWEYAIHGRNPDIIHVIESLKIEPSQTLVIESIKCHHNGIANYMKNNIVTSDKEEDDFIYAALDHYNYAFLPDYKKLLSLKNKMKNPILRQLYSLTKITIPSSETKIEIFYFQDFSNLNEIFIPSSVISIGDNVFCNCKGLKIVAFESPSSLYSIGSNAFEGCSSLARIAIPSSVKMINSGAFKNCTALNQVAIPSSVTSFGINIFDGIQSLDMTGDIKHIHSKLFENCSSLRQITIPESVTSIDDDAFCQCTSLSEITIPDSVTFIGSAAFKGCSSLKRIEIPSSVNSIGSAAFAQCSSLEQITLPVSLKSIKAGSFCMCSSLEQIEIPSSVTSIESEAFADCTKLKQVSIEEPPSLQFIGHNAFKGCCLLTPIPIPKSVQMIAKDAFDWCLLL